MSVILGIESSCDETSASICIDGKIVSNVIACQKVHESYGGVVPELASRLHQQNIIPTVHQAIHLANINKKDINAVAFTRGPGLLGSLLVGTSFAKAFSLGLGIPLIEINHMHAHILAHFIGDDKPSFPFLCLTVSGGHTQIIKVNNYFDMELLGQTTDDAAGEAFDKAAKMLGLPYPGGPLIDRYAKLGNPNAYKFPEPKIDGLDFSFSGLKTSFYNTLEKHRKQDPNFLNTHLNDYCASIQYRIVSVLMNKLKKAVEQTGITQVAIAGGVSANSGLRATLNQAVTDWNIKVYIPDFEFCTDNAAMIAIAGYYKYLDNDFVGQDISPMPRMNI
jgi:N6-L-threonylcarbamoyladenine synthase